MINIKEETRVETLPNGKKHQYKIYRCMTLIGKDSDGKKKYKRFMSRDKIDLMSQINAAKIEFQRESSRGTTFGDALETYIVGRSAICSPSTIRGYRSLQRYAFGPLSDIPVNDITPADVQQFTNEFSKTHSPKTCRNMHGLLTAVMSLARPGFQINTTLPQKSKHSIYVPDSAEIDHLARLVAGTNIEVPFLLAAFCGLRASEISGLTLENVLDDRIVINQARLKNEFNEIVTKAPKSFAGFRSVPCSTEFAEKIRSLAVGPEYVVDVSADIVSSRWTKFRQRHGLDDNLNFHALRHHFASKCLLLGIPQKYVVEMMGHSSTDMIEKVYQHTFPSAMETFAERLRNDYKNACEINKDNISDNKKP